MKNLFNKLRNLLTATKGKPVSKPEMVTKELSKSLPALYVPKSKKSRKKIKIPWTIIGNFFFELAHSMGKLVGSALMWSIFLYVTGYFVPELREKVLPQLYNWVNFYLYCMNDLAGFLWELLLKLSA